MISPALTTTPTERRAPVIATSAVLCCGLLIGLIIGIATIGVFRSEGDPPTLDGYLNRLARAQQQGGAQYTAMIGDSITVAAPNLVVCGKPVVKAAFDGARVAELVEHVAPTLKAKPPSAIVLAAGVNDAWRHLSNATPRPQQIEEFRAAYRALVIAAQALTPKVAIVSIPPVGQDGHLGVSFFDTTLIDDFNGIISGLASELRVPIVTLSALAGADGLARPGLTNDGVHPTPAGYALWRAAVDQAWARIASCG
jgi:lysophospholipase L1-like esterase